MSSLVDVLAERSLRDVGEPVLSIPGDAYLTMLVSKIWLGILAQYLTKALDGRSNGYGS